MTRYKFIIGLVLTCIVAGYVVYSQKRISNLCSANESLTTNLNTALAKNSVFEDILRSYEQAINEKDKIIKESELAMKQFNNNLKGLTDEQSKKVLSIATPPALKQLLESTDYYKRASSNSSSSIVSTVK